MRRIIQITLIICFIFVTSSCTENSRARAWGGTSNIDLEPGKKLINVTWKENDLWILTTKRNENVEPQTYYFGEKSHLGILEGVIIINEK